MMNRSVLVPASCVVAGVEVCGWSCAIQAGTKIDIRLAAKMILTALLDKATTGTIGVAPEEKI
jgi:hypothetical protein